MPGRPPLARCHYRIRLCLRVPFQSVGSGASIVRPEHSNCNIRNKNVLLLRLRRTHRRLPSQTRWTVGGTYWERTGKHVARLRGRTVEGEKQRDGRIARERELVTVVLS